MKTMLVLAALLLLSAMLIFLPRKSVHVEKLVHADPEAVWRVIMAAENYGEWNPIFVTVDGRFEVGESVSISMRTSDGSIAPVEANVKEVVPERLLRQQAGIPGVLMAYHRWELQPHSGGTLVIQHEEYRGAAVPFWSPAYVETLYAQGLDALGERLQ